MELLGDGVDEKLLGGPMSVVTRQLTLDQECTGRSDGAESGDSLTLGARQDSLTFVIIFAADRQDFNFPEHDGRDLFEDVR